MIRKSLYIYICLILFGCGTTNLSLFDTKETENYLKLRDSVLNDFDDFLKRHKENLGWHIFVTTSPDSTYTIDPLLLFNKREDKVFTTLNQRSFYPGSTSDYIDNMYGLKIDEKWYFIFGSGLVLPRRYYQYDSYEPMTFEELSYLTHDMRHKHYMKKTDDGKYIADSDKIDKLVSSDNLIWGEDWIEYYNRKMSDTLTTEELNQYEINKAKAEAECVPKEFPKPKKTPIFETKAWKNRNKNKKN